MKNITEPDYFFYGEITLAAFQLGVILGIQIEKLGQLLLRKLIQQTVFFDVLGDRIWNCVFHLMLLLHLQ